MDSLMEKSCAEMIRPSTEIISPSSITTISSTTISSVGILICTPLRITFDLGDDNFFKALIASWLLYSWYNEMPETMKIETSIIMPSEYLPTKKYIKQAAKSRINIG